jgi:hypothetical protein
MERKENLIPGSNAICSWWDNYQSYITDSANGAKHKQLKNCLDLSLQKRKSLERIWMTGKFSVLKIDGRCQSLQDLDI